MKKILLTGCSGFLASHLIEILIKEDNYILYGITEIPEFKSPKFKVYNVDIRNRKEVLKISEEIKPDITFHLAAISNVGFSWKNQKLTYEVNLIGSSNIIEALSLFSPTSRIILLGTAELYGNNKGGLISEISGMSIKSPYALSKMAMEMVGDLYISSKKSNIIKIRSFNFTGPGQDKKFVASDFASQIAEIERGERDPIIRVGNLSAVRDFSDVRDIARYLTVISERGGRGGVYNLCSGKNISIKEILNILLSFTKKKIKIIVDKNKFRPIDIPVLSGDNTQIREKFGLCPEYDIKETLLDLLNFWRSKISI